MVSVGVWLCSSLFTADRFSKRGGLTLRRETKGGRTDEGVLCVEKALACDGVMLAVHALRALGSPQSSPGHEINAACRHQLRHPFHMSEVVEYGRYVAKLF